MQNKIAKLKLLLMIAFLAICVYAVGFGYKQWKTRVAGKRVDVEITKCEVKFEVKGQCQIIVVQDRKELELDSNNAVLVDRGTSINVEVKCYDDYQIFKINAAGEERNINSPKEHTFNIWDIQSNASILIETKEVMQLNLLCGENGQISFEGVNLKGGEKKEIIITKEEKQTVSITPSDSFELEGIYVNGIVQEVQMTSDEGGEGQVGYTFNCLKNGDSIEVKFKQKKYRVFINSNKGGSVAIDGESLAYYEFESNINHTMKILLDSVMYEIRTLKINEKEISLNNLQYENDVSYYLHLDVLKNNTIIEIEYDIIPNISSLEMELEDMIEIQLSDELSGSYDVDTHTYYLKGNKKGRVELSSRLNDYLFALPEKNDYYYFKEKVNIGSDGIYSNIIFKNIVSNKRYCFNNKLKLVFDDIPPFFHGYSLVNQENLYILDVVIGDNSNGGIRWISIGNKEQYIESLDTGEGRNQNSISYLDTIWIEKQKQDIYKGTIPHPKSQQYLWCMDQAGNISDPVLLDLTPPTIKLTTNSIITNQDIKVTGEVADEHNSVAAVFYSTSKEAFDSHQIYDEKRDDKSVYKATLSEDKQSFYFQINAKKSDYKIYYIWAYDSVGNKVRVPAEFLVKIDKDAPIVNLVKKMPADNWTNQQIYMEFAASDGEAMSSSGIQAVYYNRGVEDKRIPIDMATFVDGRFSIRTPLGENTIPTPMSETYYVWVVDKAGNVSEKEKVEVNIDVQEPMITKAELTVLNQVNNESQVANYEHGLYSNDMVVVSVSAEDLGISSGVHEILLYRENEILQRQKVNEDGQASFLLQVGFTGKLSFASTDYAGNESKPVLLQAVNSKYRNSILCIEQQLPAIAFETGKPVYYDTNEKEWYHDKVDFTFKLMDEKSGVATCEVFVNGVQVKKGIDGKLLQEQLEKTYQKQVSLQITVGDKKVVEPQEDGSYVVDIVCTDYAGNKIKKTKKLYIDDVKPKVSKFIFTAKGVQEGNHEPVEKDRYGYYFTEAVKVDIYAVDLGASSGVKVIRYYLMDYSKDSKGVRSREITKKVDSENKISFVIQANFKGQIYASAIDNTNNVSARDVKPQGVIIELGQADSESAKVDFQMDETSWNTGNGQRLYNKETNVVFVVEDSFNGIKEICWSVSSTSDKKGNYSGKIAIDQYGFYTGDTSYVTIADKELNLVTKVEGRIPVTNNSNDILVKVKVVDRANRVLEREILLSIDKTKPVIEISFEDGDRDSKYYNHARKAVLTVTERNFEPSKIRIIAKTSNGKQANLGQWNSYGGGSSDFTKHEMVVTFEEDGAYEFYVEGTDVAQNAIDTMERLTFVIDKDLPKVSVSFEDGKEGRYYNRARVALITVSDINFSKDAMEVLGVALVENKVTAYPKCEIMGESNNNYTYKISFKEDGEYSLGVRVKDLAGNMVELTEVSSFIIDTKAPTVEITGVENQMAYASNVVPILMIVDENYDEEQVDIQIQGIRNKTLGIVPEKSNITNGESIRIDCFPKDESMDDIYTMTVKVCDQAGNETIQEILFSVNRYGSSYRIGDGVKEKIGKYFMEEFEVHIYEVNANELNPEEICAKLVVNGVPRELSLGAQYQVKDVSEHKGWYEYEYVFDKSLFEQEGMYQILLSSVDMAGNLNETINEKKVVTLNFGIDKTPPVTIPLNIQNKETYGVENRKVSIKVSDNLILEKVQIYLNDQEIAYEVSEENYTFDVPSKNTRQRIRVVATDAAGNMEVKDINDFYVTTSMWIQWKNNSLLVGVTICFVAAVLVVVGYFYVILLKKKQKVR